MKKGRETKPHIGIYGRRNNGKSSFINCITGQEIAIVSGVAGTTTDPVKKSYEITNFGPVILIDTAGIDDVGELGNKRISKTLESIKIIDLGILVITNNTFDSFEKQLIAEFTTLMQDAVYQAIITGAIHQVFFDIDHICSLFLGMSWLTRVCY